MIDPAGPKFDRTNAFIAAGTFLVSFIVYNLTVQPTFSFWDCGEFVACAYILGIPHPPGTPLFVLLGRVFSLIPFVEDISHRINYLSVIGSAFTAMFSYLLTVRLIKYFFGDERETFLSRYIAYVGGVAGAFFVAFSATNWGNSVEAEVYGIALALSVALVWMALRYSEVRGTPGGHQMGHHDVLRSDARDRNSHDGFPGGAGLLSVLHVQPRDLGARLACWSAATSRSNFCW